MWSTSYQNKEPSSEDSWIVISLVILTKSCNTYVKNGNNTIQMVGTMYDIRVWLSFPMKILDGEDIVNPTQQTQKIVILKSFPSIISKIERLK